MRVAVALLLAAPAAANPYCSLLPANAPGFEMRAVHTEENQWLAEIELVEWVEGARIKLEWAGGMTIAQANHAEVVDPEYNGATVVLAPTGPLDGSLRVVLHLEGTKPSTPAITCSLPGPPPSPPELAPVDERDGYFDVNSDDADYVGKASAGDYVGKYGSDDASAAPGCLGPASDLTGTRRR